MTIPTAVIPGLRVFPIILICPQHGLALEPSEDGAALRCPDHCRFPIARGIPRFVPADNYAAGFGLQWNVFRRTQLDSYTGTRISADRLKRIVGGDLGVLRGKTVLEAGCGAGRFTEVMLENGARVFATDLSSAVDANLANCGRFPDYFVCQADITSLPVAPESFDIVVCIGVVQHTPSPEGTIARLCDYVRPGGLLFVDHYSPGYAVTLSRRLLRRFLLTRPPDFGLRFCEALVRALWPIHRRTFAWRPRRGLRHVRGWWLRLSPVVDYLDAYGQLAPDVLYQWAILDTHDTLTDRFKHLRSADQIAAHLEACGMEDITTACAGNGVEVRARKPLGKARRPR